MARTWTLTTQAKSEDLISAEELDRRRPPSAEDHALGNEYLAALDRLEAEQNAEVTEVQAHLLYVVPIAAHYLRGDPAKTLAARAASTGLLEAEIRAGAVALRAIGVEASETRQAT